MADDIIEKARLLGFDAAEWTDREAVDKAVQAFADRRCAGTAPGTEARERAVEDVEQAGRVLHQALAATTKTVHHRHHRKTKE